MPWKKRNHTKYHYQQKRYGDQVRSRYVGRDGKGELIATLDAMRSEAEALIRAADAEAWRAEKAEADAQDREARGISAVAWLLARLALEAAGYRQHKRGDWRKRRAEMRDEVAKAEKEPYIGVPRRKPRPEAERLAMIEVLNRAKAGDESAMPRVRELFDEDPERMLWVAGGEVQQYAEDTLIHILAGPTNLMTKEAIGRKMSSLRAELAGPYPTPIERLLAERVASCWLDCHRRDWQAVDLEKEGTTFAKSSHYDKLRTRAHARYVSALKALALVRKLAVTTAIQVNVGSVSVEAAGPAAGVVVDVPGA